VGVRGEEEETQGWVEEGLEAVFSEFFLEFLEA